MSTVTIFRYAFANYIILSFTRNRQITYLNILSDKATLLIKLGQMTIVAKYVRLH